MGWFFTTILKFKNDMGLLNVFNKPFQQASFSFHCPTQTEKNNHSDIFSFFPFLAENVLLVWKESVSI